MTRFDFEQWQDEERKNLCQYFDRSNIKRHKSKQLIHNYDVSEWLISSGIISEQILILAKRKNGNHFIHYDYDVALITLKKAFENMSPICLTKRLTEDVLKYAKLYSPGNLPIVVWNFYVFIYFRYFVGYEDINKPTKSTLLYQMFDIRKTVTIDCPCKEELDAKICSNLRLSKQYQLCVSKYDSPTTTTSGVKVTNMFSLHKLIDFFSSFFIEIELMQYSWRTSLLQRKIKICRH